MVFSFWKSVRLSKLLRQSFGISSGREDTVRPRSCSCGVLLGEHDMIRIIYNLLWPLGLLFFLPGYLLKMFRRGGFPEKNWQRVGIYRAAVATTLMEPKFTLLY